MKPFILILAAWLVVVLGSCSKSDPSPPQFRVQNNRTTNASLQVKTSGGSTININNVAPGTTSNYQQVATGQVDITVQIQGESGDFTATFMALNDKSFTIVVANTTPPTVTVVSP